MIQVRRLAPRPARSGQNRHPQIPSETIHFPPIVLTRDAAVVQDDRPVRIFDSERTADSTLHGRERLPADSDEDVERSGRPARNRSAPPIGQGHQRHDKDHKRPSRRDIKSSRQHRRRRHRHLPPKKPGTERDDPDAQGSSPPPDRGTRAEHPLRINGMLARSHRTAAAFKPPAGRCRPTPPSSARRHERRRLHDARPPTALPDRNMLTNHPAG